MTFSGDAHRKPKERGIKSAGNNFKKNNLIELKIISLKIPSKVKFHSR
jgi:hypothetical protein